MINRVSTYQYSPKKIQNMSFEKKDDSNLLVKPPSENAKWRKQQPEGAFSKLKFPVAATVLATGIGTSAVIAPPPVNIVVDTAAVAVATVETKKRLAKPTQSLAAHEVAGHFGVNCALRDQVIPTSVQARQFNPRYYVEQDKSRTEPWLTEEELATKEDRLKKLLANALICEGPYALAELKGEDSTSFPAPTAFVRRPIGCLKYLAKSVTDPTTITETDQFQALQTCWEAAGLTASNPIEKVQDFIDLAQNLRPTAKALLMQYDPEVLEEMTAKLESKNRLNYEELDRIGRTQGLYQNMPELAPRLKEKVAT